MTLTRSFLALATAAAVTLPLGASAQEHSHETLTPPRHDWSFAGPFGRYDQAQLQRGFKVYREVCAACHSIKMLKFRNLADPGGPGYSEAQAAAVAAEYKIKDTNDQGEAVERDGRVADAFPWNFPNEGAARAALGGVLPPDLSVIAKARTYERGFPWFIFDLFTQFQEQGPDYIAALMTGYKEKPADFTLPSPSMHYNIYFPGHAIGMPPPLAKDQVTYEDGTPQTVEQYGKDVAAFLMWVAEPHLVERKRLGLQVMLFLLVFAGLLYFTKKKVWHEVELHPEVLEKKS
jgi:ubiquinol-cytochrome c reductase cytochrome b/c1 subunit